MICLEEQIAPHQRMVYTVRAPSEQIGLDVVVRTRDWNARQVGKPAVQIETIQMHDIRRARS